MNNKRTESKNSGFTQVPNSFILAGRKLTDGEFRFYCVIKYHSFQKSFCYPGRETISKEMGASIAKVDRIKRAAIYKGLIGKSRRGQGKTNIYRHHNIFFSEADKSSVTSLANPSVTRKEDVVNNTKLNNYLESQTSKTPYKEKTTNSEPLTKTPTDIVTRVRLNKMEKSLIEGRELNQHGLLETDLVLAKEAIYYYLRRYREICGVEHPNYRRTQLIDCFRNMIFEIKSLRDGSWTIEEIPHAVEMVIERWFATTSNEPNNLLLSHFVGGENNQIFTNCFNATVFDTGTK